MTITARYPIKIGTVLIPKGEPGRLATLAEARTTFPAISVKPGAPFLSVIFRDLAPCLVLKKQVELHEPATNT